MKHRDLPPTTDTLQDLAARRTAFVAYRKAKPDTLKAVLLPHVAGKYRVVRALAMTPVRLP